MRAALVVLTSIALALAAGCVLKLFGLGPSLEEAAGALGRALGVEFKMQLAPEQVHRFERWVSRGGPPRLEAIGPAKGPALLSLGVKLAPGADRRLGELLELILPQWADRRAWLRSALHKLEASRQERDSIRLEPKTNRVVVLEVDRRASLARLTVMTLVWDDYARGLEAKQKKEAASRSRDK